MQDIVFGKKKEEVVKPKAKFIPCVKNTVNKISIKKEDAVLIGKIDIKNIPIIKEKEETLCFLENSDGFYDGKTFGSIENAIDVSDVNLDTFKHLSLKYMKDINRSSYKVKTVKEFSKI